jgi:uncharacterized membrane protein
MGAGHQRRGKLGRGEIKVASIPFSFCVPEFVGKAGIMDIGEFFTSYAFMGIMAVFLIALIALLLFLRNRRPED